MKDMHGKQIKLRDEVVYTVIRSGSSNLHTGKIITIADNYVRAEEDQTLVKSVLKNEKNIFVK